MKTSYIRIRQFVGAANDYLEKFKDESKIKLAIQKMAERVVAVNQEYQDAVDDIELDLANTDSNGSVLYKIENGRRVYEFKKEDLKARKAKIAALESDPERFQIHEQIVSDLPPKFPEEYRQYFEGFVLAKK